MAAKRAACGPSRGSRSAADRTATAARPIPSSCRALTDSCPSSANLAACRTAARSAASSASSPGRRSAFLSSSSCQRKNSCSRRPRERMASSSDRAVRAAAQAECAAPTATPISRPPAYPSSRSVCVSVSRRAWCSCCPWTATRLRASSRSCTGLALRPSILAAPRFPSSRSRTRAEPPESKMLSTVARCAPCLTWSAPPRAPRVRPSASTMSDFPLPVSPVRRLRPGPKRTRDSATSARSRTLSSLSNLLHRNQRSAPTELLGQPAVEALRRPEPHDLEGTRMGAAPQPVSRLDRATPAATVDAQLGRPANHRQSDVLAGWEHDRPHREREWIHGHEHEVAQRRFEDGPAARKRVCGGPRGRRDHHPVGVYDPDRLAANVDLHPEHPCLTRAIDDRLVEPDRRRDGLFVSGQSCLQHVALFDSVVAPEESLQARLELVRVELRQEAQASEVDAQGDDQGRAFEPAGDRAHGAVAIGHPGLAVVRLDRLDRTRGHGLFCARRADDADLHAGRRCRKISWLPSAPVSSEGASARTSYPWPAHHSRSRRRAASTATGSRTTPPFPTSPLPTWNWGLKRATTSASGAASRRAGSTFSNPMKETSTTMSDTGSGNDSSSRALTRSITTTRGSDRSRQCSRPRPTSIAYTRAAPRLSSTSVKPPVDAPMSAHTRPDGSTPKVSSAGASLSAPRLA